MTYLSSALDKVLHRLYNPHCNIEMNTMPQFKNQYYISVISVETLVAIMFN